MEASSSQNVESQETNSNSIPGSEIINLSLVKKEKNHDTKENLRSLDCVSQSGNCNTSANNGSSQTTGNPSASMETFEKMPLMPEHIKFATLMKKMGYEGGPLGVHGVGVTEPITMPPLNVVNRAGLGYVREGPKKISKIPKQNGKFKRSWNNNIPNTRRSFRPNQHYAAYPTLKKVPFPRPFQQRCNMRVTEMNTNTRRIPMPKRNKFNLTVLRAAIKLMADTEVASVTIPYNQMHKKKKRFVTYFLEMVNNGCNLSLVHEEELQLAEELKVLMTNSQWQIVGSASIDMKILILKKIPSTNTINPMDVINLQDILQKRRAIDRNGIPMVFITDKRLNFLVNNIIIPNTEGNQQKCTFSLAFRLIVLVEILEFSKNNETSLIIHLGAVVDKNEFEFINKLVLQATTKPNFESKIENDTYEHIAFVILDQNLCLDIECSSLRRLIVRKLPDNPENRGLSRRRLRERYHKNNASNHVDNTSVSNNSENTENPTNVTAQCNNNEQKIEIINKNDENLSDDGLEADAIKINDIEIDDKSIVKNEPFKCLDDDVILIEKVYEMIEVSDEEADPSENIEADESENLSTVNEEMESVAVQKEATVNDEPKINEENMERSENTEVSVTAV